jgi:hypothetical protein
VRLYGGVLDTGGKRVRSQPQPPLLTQHRLVGQVEHAVRAVALLTVSDHIRRGEHLSSEARRSSFDAMIHIALETAFES